MAPTTKRTWKQGPEINEYRELLETKDIPKLEKKRQKVEEEREKEIEHLQEVMSKIRQLEDIVLQLKAISEAGKEKFNKKLKEKIHQLEGILLQLKQIVKASKEKLDEKSKAKMRTIDKLQKKLLQLKEVGKAGTKEFEEILKGIKNIAETEKKNLAAQKSRAYKNIDNYDIRLLLLQCGMDKPAGIEEINEMRAKAEEAKEVILTVNGRVEFLEHQAVCLMDEVHRLQQQIPPAPPPHEASEPVMPQDHHDMEWTAGQVLTFSQPKFWLRDLDIPFYSSTNHETSAFPFLTEAKTPLSNGFLNIDPGPIDTVEETGNLSNLAAELSLT